MWVTEKPNPTWAGPRPLNKPTPIQQLSPVGPSTLPTHIDIPCTSQPPCNNYLQLVPPVCPSIWTFFLQASPHATTISSWSLQSAHPYGHFFCKPTPHATTTSSLSFQYAHPYGHFLSKPTPMQQLSPVGPSSLPIHMDIYFARQPPCNNYLQLVPLQFACNAVGQVTRT